MRTEVLFSNVLYLNFNIQFELLCVIQLSYDHKLTDYTIYQCLLTITLYHFSAEDIELSIGKPSLEALSPENENSDIWKFIL